MKRKLLCSCFIGLLVFFPLYAIDFSVEKDGKQYDLGIGGYGGFFGGQVIRGTGIKADIDHQWLQNPFLGILLEATINKRLRIVLNAEVLQLFSYLADESLVGKEHEMGQFWDASGLYIRQARCEYIFGDPENYSLTVNAGKWHYKYNPEVRNLGEYLFRGTAYPTYYETIFDDPTYPMLGAMVTTEMKGNPIVNPKLDLILTSETRKYPMQDWSLAGVASVNFGNFWDKGYLLSLGGGLCLDRVIPADPFFTTPKEGKPGLENVYYADTTFTFLHIDPNTWDSVFDTSITDQRYYTFQSTKASFRATLDLKSFFDWDVGSSKHTKRFTEHDLKFYMELGILGFDNYPNDYEATRNGSNPEDTAKYSSHFYTDIKERMPIVVGVNLPFVPFFHIFDVLSFEFEFFPHTYALGYEDSFRKGWPKATEKDIDFVQSYWSIYAMKEIGQFKFAMQFARDHMRPHVNSFNHKERNDVLVEWDDWWWGAGFLFRF